MKKYFKLSVLIMLTIGLILGSFSISFAQKKEVAVLLPGTVEFFSVMRQGTDPEGKYAGVVSYIGRSEIGAGIIQGEMAELLLGDKEASIVLIEGNPGTAPQRMREEGFLKIAAKHPNWTIVDKRPIEGWTKEGALAFMEAFLQSGRKVDLVSCQWWSGAIA